MKSIKAGRGPSGMNFIGSIIGILFGILWLISASSITQSAREEFSRFGMSGPADTASVVFPLFGLLFIGFGVVNAIYQYRNYKCKEHCSIAELLEAGEEGDPVDSKIKKEISFDSGGRDGQTSGKDTKES